MHNFYIDEKSIDNDYIYTYKDNDGIWKSTQFHLDVEIDNEIELDVCNMVSTLYEGSVSFTRTLNRKFYRYAIYGNIDNFDIGFMDTISMSDFCEIKDYPNKMVFELYNFGEFEFIEKRFKNLKFYVDKSYSEVGSLFDIRKEDKYSLLVINMPNEILNNMAILKEIFDFLGYYAKAITDVYIDRDLICPHCFSHVDDKYKYHLNSRLEISIYRNLSKDKNIKCPICRNEFSENQLIELDTPMIEVCSKINNLFKEYTYPITKFCCSGHNIMHTITPYIIVKNINLSNNPLYSVYLYEVLKDILDKNEGYSELFRLADTDDHDPNKAAIYFKGNKRFIEWVKTFKNFDYATDAMMRMFEDLFEEAKNYLNNTTNE